MALKFSNNASSLLTADISVATPTVTVTSGTGALFPTTSDGTFLITVQDSMGNNEIMLCTARNADSFTVTRAQEGTLARSFSAGAVVENRFTAGSMSSFARSGEVQPIAAGLTSISGLTTAADNIIYTTAADTYATASCTAAGRALLDDADAAAQRTTLGLGDAAVGTIGTTVQAYDADTVKSDVTTAYTAQQFATPVVLTGQTGTISLNANAHQDVHVTATGGVTFAAPTNSGYGKYMFITLYSATAPTITWDATFLGNADATLPTAFTAGKFIYLNFRYVASSGWVLLGMVTGA